MTKEEALSEEIDYYKAPNITISLHKRCLTGKDLIHECNKIIKEDQESEMIHIGPASLKRVRSHVIEIKKYAIKNPEKIIANEFYFEGIFTHFNNGYNTCKAYVIYVPKMEQYIVEQVYK